MYSTNASGSMRESKVLHRWPSFPVIWAPLEIPPIMSSYVWKDEFPDEYEIEG
jgi:hypothetical protein